MTEEDVNVYGYEYTMRRRRSMCTGTLSIGANREGTSGRPREDDAE